MYGLHQGIGNNDTVFKTIEHVSAHEIFTHQRFTSPEPPSSHNPNVDPELERIILKALAKSPDERYPTGAEMREDLERLTASKAAQPEDSGEPESADETRDRPERKPEEKQKREGNDAPRSRARIWNVDRRIAAAITATAGDSRQSIRTEGWKILPGSRRDQVHRFLACSKGRRTKAA